MKVTKKQAEVAKRIGKFTAGVGTGFAKGVGETAHSIMGLSEDVVAKALRKKNYQKVFTEKVKEKAYTANKPGEGTGKLVEDLAEWTAAAGALGQVVPAVAKGGKIGKALKIAREFGTETGAWAGQEYLKMPKRSLKRALGTAAKGMAVWTAAGYPLGKLGKIVKKIKK